MSTLIEELREAVATEYMDTRARTKLTSIVDRMREAEQKSNDGMLPDALAPHADEWYRMCERRFSAERIVISGELAEAIVATVVSSARRNGDECRACQGQRLVRLMFDLGCSQIAQQHVATLIGALSGRAHYSDVQEAAAYFSTPAAKTE